MDVVCEKAGLNWSENGIFDMVRIFLLELVRIVRHILELVRPGKTPLIGIGPNFTSYIGIGPTTFYYFGIGPTAEISAAVKRCN